MIRERADGGHEEDDSKRRGTWRGRKKERLRDTQGESRRRQRKRKKKREGDEEGSESEAAGAVGYLLLIQTPTMPL